MHACCLKQCSSEAEGSVLWINNETLYLKDQHVTVVVTIGIIGITTIDVVKSVPRVLDSSNTDTTHSLKPAGFIVRRPRITSCSYPIQLSRTHVVPVCVLKSPALVVWFSVPFYFYHKKESTVPCKSVTDRRHG